MKYILILFLFFSSAAFAQESLKQTLSFNISGKVKNSSTITLDSLNSYPVKVIGDIKVTNHLGEFKHEDDQLKGVLLKDILSHTVLDAGSPKLYSRFYFTCKGNDGYAVVYSWNELFNTEVGNHVFIIMEKNGIEVDKMPESIQMTSASDFKTGRRYLHNLEKIVVGQVD
ncbi:molybdopterin-binding protein [Mucilaginibacter sp.]|uniref:molybdopterin-binding protein n=1 Tax=Mucilaginibacter sp. TaxID=1882438 RepID=UPI0028450D2E|nr:molybdopterin-binding protein [Mucilaginibacter sp.]MDR3696570.1 molybdopterin-binding protein [Mucilaginibacter sp.]